MNFVIPENKLSHFIPIDHKDVFMKKYRIYQCELAAINGDLEGLYHWSKFVNDDFTNLTVENAIKHGFMEWISTVGFQDCYMEYIIKHDQFEWFKTTGMTYIDDCEWNYDKMMNYAIRHKKLHFIEYMIDQGIEFNDNNMCDAIQTGDIELVKRLLDHCSIECVEFEYAICRAAASGNVEMCQWICEQFPDAEIDDVNCMTEAIESRNAECVKFFIDKEVPCDDEDLTTAVTFSTPEIVKLLLQQGCKPDKAAIELTISDASKCNIARNRIHKYWTDAEYTEITKLFLETCQESKWLYFTKAFVSNIPELFRFVFGEYASAKSPQVIHTFLRHTNVVPTAAFLESIQSYFNISSEAFAIAKHTFETWRITDQSKQVLCETVDWCFKHIPQEQITKLFAACETSCPTLPEDLAEVFDQFAIQTRDKFFKFLEMEWNEQELNYDLSSLQNQKYMIEKYHKRAMKYLHDEPTIPLIAKTVIEDIVCQYV